MPAATAPSLVLDTDWSRGVIRDAPRGAIPAGGLYDSADYLLHEPGLAQKRGGTTYAGPAMTGATYAAGVAYAPFAAGSKILGIGENGHLYTVTSGTTTDISTMGSAFATIDTPKFRVGATKELLVITANDGTTAPKAYNGTAVANLGGSPPAGKYATVYKNRFVLGGTSANPDRLFFSDVPDIESAWDTTESWVDTDFAITGLAALQNAILVFSKGRTQRITGTTPPPGSDFDRQPIGDVGCTDARSIVVYEGRVIFANARGMYWTDGTTYQCLTRQAGDETLWRDTVSRFGATNISAGVLGSYLIVTFLGPGPTYFSQLTLICNLPRNSWARLTNIDPMMLASTVGTADECYYADATTNRIVALSTILTPSATYKNDADGTAVTPLLETRLLGGGPTLKHFGLGYFSMDIRDAASDNPTMAVSVAKGLEATTFAAVKESPFSESADSNRYRFTAGKVSQGLTVRFQQTNASAKTELYAVEVAARGLPLQAGGE